MPISSTKRNPAISQKRLKLLGDIWISHIYIYIYLRENIIENDDHILPWTAREKPTTGLSHLQVPKLGLFIDRCGHLGCQGCYGKNQADVKIS
jgi:hypothetical protein